MYFRMKSEGTSTLGNLVVSNVKTPMKKYKLRRNKYVHNRFRRKSLLKSQMMMFLGILALVYSTMGDTGNGTNMKQLTEEVRERSFVHRTLFSIQEVTELPRDLQEIDCINSSLIVERPLNASLEAYPQDIFTEEQQRQGAIVLHIIAILYMFVGLAIVCDDYFEPALAGICESLSLTEDVAGATFMAAGGSAPELFTSIMGVASDSDIGFGTIIGSATFNVLFVIAMCSFVTYNLELTWWPLCRDCVFYCFSIIVLVICAVDKNIYWYEAAILLFCYMVYITIMYFNHNLERYVQSSLENSRPPSGGIRYWVYKAVVNNLFNYLMYAVIIANVVIIIVDLVNKNEDNNVHHIFSGIFIAEMVIKLFAMGFFGYWKDPMNAFDGILVILILVEVFLSGSVLAGGLRVLKVIRFFRALRIVRLYRMINVETVDKSTQTEDGDWRRPSILELEGNHIIKLTSILPLSPDQEKAMIAAKVNRGSDAEKVDSDEEEEDDDDEPTNPFEIPDGALSKIYWMLTFPLSFLLFITIPDCRRPIFKKFFFVTFLMCIIWIGLMAYLLVWMAITVTVFLQVPEPVMGLTVLAAGTSIPDLLSSMAVARKGFGDMAVSSSIGSNVFDILIGLPAPWFFKTTLITPNQPVAIGSDGLTIMVLTLFIMVACVVALIHLSKWRLTKRLGYGMVFLYILFMVESLLLEYDILFKTPECT